MYNYEKTMRTSLAIGWLSIADFCAMAIEKGVDVEYYLDQKNRAMQRYEATIRGIILTEQQLTEIKSLTNSIKRHEQRIATI